MIMLIEANESKVTGHGPQKTKSGIKGNCQSAKPPRDDQHNQEYTVQHKNEDMAYSKHVSTWKYTQH